MATIENLCVHQVQTRKKTEATHPDNVLMCES